ncbi:MAG: SapC family protein [Gammaproteobacteria bacterium]
MTQHALLNNVAHKDLRVITRHAAEFGDNVGSVVTFPTEYADVQREYPILFRKEKNTGDYLSVALLGFENGENLFLEDGRWNARYIPGVLARGPFLIGFQERATQGEVRSDPVVHVDLDHPRVSTTEGEPLFLENGGRTRYLDRIATILNGLGAGMEVSKLMFAAFTPLDLIEPVKVTVTMSPEEQHVLQGYYTINEDKLAALDGEALVKLNRSGFLHAAFLIVASLSNVKTLIDLKHRRRQRTAA